MFHRRLLLTATVVASAVAALLPGVTQAQTTTKILVGFPPGGGTDAIARVLAEEGSGIMPSDKACDEDSNAERRKDRNLQAVLLKHGSKSARPNVSSIRIGPHLRHDFWHIDRKFMWR